MKQRYVLIVLAILVAGIYVPSFFYLRHVDRTTTGLDDIPSHAFPIHESDSLHYTTLAQNIVHSHVFSTDEVPPFTLNTFRTPGYPLFVAGILVLHLPLETVIVLQWIMVFFAAWLIYRMSSMVLPENASSYYALIPPILYILSPTNIFYANIIMSEVLCTLLLLLVVYILFCMKQKPWWTYVVAGVLMGYTILTRSIVIGLPILFSIGLYIWWRRGTRKINIYKHIATFIVTTVIVCIPWVARNHAVAGVWGFSALPALNLYQYNLDYFTHVRFSEEEADRIMADLRAQMGGLSNADMNNIEYSGQILSASIQFLRNHAISYATYHVIASGRSLIVSGFKSVVTYESEVLSDRWGYSDTVMIDTSDALAQGNWNALRTVITQQGLFLGEVVAWFFLLVCGVGMICIKRTNIRMYGIVYIVIIGYFGCMIGPVAIPRYRLPIEPFILIAALPVCVYGMEYIRRYAIKRFGSGTTKT